MEPPDQAPRTRGMRLGDPGAVRCRAEFLEHGHRPITTRILVLYQSPRVPTVATSGVPVRAEDFPVYLHKHFGALRGEVDVANDGQSVERILQATGAQYASD